MGPRIDPRGTPEDTGREEESEFPIVAKQCTMEVKP